MSKKKKKSSKTFYLGELVIKITFEYFVHAVVGEEMCFVSGSSLISLILGTGTVYMFKHNIRDPKP